MANYPHVEWLPLHNNGTASECAIMARDSRNNTFFIELTSLDRIDKERMAKILTGRSASQFQLWDLMSQTTLGNGINALEYFHQYVKVLTPQGTVVRPQIGVTGMPVQPDFSSSAPESEG